MLQLPYTMDLRSLVIDDSAEAPASNSLLVAGDPATRSLLRIVIGDAGEVATTEWLSLDGVEGPIRAMAIGPGGMIRTRARRASS